MAYIFHEDELPKLLSTVPGRERASISPRRRARASAPSQGGRSNCSIWSFRGWSP